MNISDKQLEKLMKMASKSMGISEEKLKENLKAKNFEDPKVNELINNPHKAKEMLDNPDIKKMINKLLGTE